jgi:hypothetical protein
LVLGPLAENRLFLSSDNYGLAWLGRPGVLIIFAITLFGIIYPILAIWLLGFSYSIPVSMLLYLRLAAKEKWPMALAMAFFTWLFV